MQGNKEKPHRTFPCKRRGGYCPPLYRAAVRLPVHRPAGVSLGFGIIHERYDGFAIHFHQLAQHISLVGQLGVNLVDNITLYIAVMRQKSASKQGGQIGHGLALQFLDLEALPLHHLHRFSGVFQHIFHIVVLDVHFLCHNSSLLAVIQSDDRGGCDGDIHAHYFVYAAAGGIHGKLPLEGELAVRAGGGNRTAGLRAAKPDGIIRFCALFRFQRLVIGQRVVRRETQAVHRLNTGDVGLHLVRQGGGFQHFRITAKVRELLDVHQFGISAAGCGFYHQKNLIGRDSDKSSFLSFRCHIIFGKWMFRPFRHGIVPLNDRLTHCPCLGRGSWKCV